MNRLALEMKLEEFTSMILPIKDKLYRFALSILGNISEAEDVVQEVFLKLWKNQGELEAIQQFEAWCMTMTKNLSLDKLKSKHRKTGLFSGEMDFSDNAKTPYQQTELNDTVNRIGFLIGQLPEKQREVIHLRDVEGFSYKEIADILKINMEQVKVNLFRARKQIRAQLINTESYGLSRD